MVFRKLTISFAAAMFALAAPVAAKPDYAIREIPTNGTTLHVRIAGRGPAVVLLHGFGDTGDMWEPLAEDLARDHRVIVPDLRGMGLSAHPASGYDKKTQGVDIAGILDALGVDKVDVVGHDIGNMVAYAFTAQYPDRVRKLVLIDAPVPGLGDAWEWLKRQPSTWHFNFYGPDEERLVAGRERIFLDRFYNELSAHPESITEATRSHYAALYARPGGMHSAFSQFAAFPQDEKDNQQLFARVGKLKMPVLAVGGDKSLGVKMGESAGFFASNVQRAIIPDAGHWLMEERPEETVRAVAGFIRTP
ncbi:alpha/beta fold hydrolase [Flavisphingomonas formosensis]|uniref:alpha/beta fold hydrolase n=1 Tax=Flavisphingomonas formosensis TaxID=861534 RepID=UPI0012FADE5D|nr:alpha/beta hydrolase [Sphingomonas formosensis]